MSYWSYATPVTLAARRKLQICVRKRGEKRRRNGNILKQGSCLFGVKIPGQRRSTGGAEAWDLEVEMEDRRAGSGKAGLLWDSWGV